jgi:hypothetical protein
MSSKKTNPQITNFPSQPENVETVDQERKQDAPALRHEEGKEAGIWTEVTSDKTAKRIKRLGVLAQQEKKNSTPPKQERRINPSFTEQRFRRATALSLAEERKQDKKQLNTLQEQVVSLSSTLDKILLMLKNQTATMPSNQPIAQAAIVNSPPKSEGDNEKSNVPHFNVNSPSSPVSSNAGSFKDALGRRSPSISSISIMSATSSEAGSTTATPKQSSPTPKKGNSATSSPKINGSPIAKFNLPESAPAKAIPATSEKNVLTSPSSPPPPAKKLSADHDGGKKKVKGKP